ncbi:signal peptidase I [Vulgatibacter sp.]|uniref:signal peptidase I n=1 Tax=Vulgatibacter sp. TaxID=1971226 RepID=UPI0035685180
MSKISSEATGVATSAPASAPAAGEKKREKEKPKGFFAAIKSIAPAVAVALAIRAFLFEPFSIPSGSMLPTLQIGDYVVVSKFAYGVRVPFTNEMLWQSDLPDRGDVIVFERPTPPSENLIKRVVGLPGEIVRIEGGVVFVDGVKQPRELLETAYPLDDYDERSRRWVATRADLYVEQLAQEDGSPEPHFVLEQVRGRAPDGPYQVPAGHVLVLGDNRDNSADSRVWGYVPLGHIRGRADVIGFSWGQDGLRTDRLFRGLDAEVPSGG